jgi:hypothetical protein
LKTGPSEFEKQRYSLNVIGYSVNSFAFARIPCPAVAGLQGGMAGDGGIKN